MTTGKSSKSQPLVIFLTPSPCVCDVCRIANGVLEKVGPQLVSRNLQQVEEWLSGASEVLDILGKFTVLKLFKLAITPSHTLTHYNLVNYDGCQCLAHSFSPSSLLPLYSESYMFLCLYHLSPHPHGQCVSVWSALAEPSLPAGEESQDGTGSGIPSLWSSLPDPPPAALSL